MGEIIRPNPEELLLPESGIILPPIVDLYVGDIDRNWADKTIRTLDEIEHDAPDSPVRLLIDGYGGGVDSAISVADKLLAMENPIITEARSKCFSAEVLLLSCGQERYAHPRSRFMMHQSQLPKWEYSGALQEIGKPLRTLFENNKRLIYMIADNINFDRHQLYKETKSDNWFDVQKAHDYYHLVTDILPDPKK